MAVRRIWEKQDSLFYPPSAPSACGYPLDTLGEKLKLLVMSN